MSKFLITEEEKYRILNLHKFSSKNHYLLFESDIENFVPKTRSEVMALQQSILHTEELEGLLKNEDNKTVKGQITTSAPISYGNDYLSGFKFSGSSLCDGFCNAIKAIDGIYGPKTKNAFAKYKSNKSFKDRLKFELDEDFESYTHLANDWQIPATSDKIKAFQYFIWKVIEHHQPKVDPKCDDNCYYTSMLCGGNPCRYQSAVDGFWGSNTKKAWSQYKKIYLNELGFLLDLGRVKDVLNDNDELVKKYAIKY
jgi:hypothetical protein